MNLEPQQSEDLARLYRRGFAEYGGRYGTSASSKDRPRRMLWSVMAGGSRLDGKAVLPSPTKP